MKRCKSIILAIFVLSGTLYAYGCTPTEPERDAEPDKYSQLYIANYDGGVGTEWLDRLVVQFEELHKDTVFEPGSEKRGVQIWTDASKTYSASNVFSSMSGSFIDIYFIENMHYNDFVSSNLLLDISDIVTAPLEGETDTDENPVSIESKLSENQQTSLKALNGKYYALPHYETTSGLAYDIDVFEDAEKPLYFSATGSGFVTNLTETRSAGPDGKLGTYDDGLPSSYEEFYQLIDYMVNERGITPFVWPGSDQYYTGYTMNGLYLNYVGADEAMLNFTFGKGADSAETKIVTGFDNNGKPVTKTETISDSNGYLVREQAGKYYPLEFFEYVLSDSRHYHKLALNSTFSYMDAAEAFIYGWLEQKPIAFMCTGTFWENEAADYYERAVMEFGKRAENRRFGWMPLPGLIEGRADYSAGNYTTQTLASQHYSYGFVNGNLKSDVNQANLAKEFLKFCYTHQSLVDFSLTTGIPKYIDYDLADEEVAQLSSFYQSLWNIRRTAERIYPMSDNPIYINNQASLSFQTGANFWTSYVGTDVYSSPIQGLKNKAVTPRQYFDGMKLTSAQWEQYL